MELRGEEGVVLGGWRMTERLEWGGVGEVGAHPVRGGRALLFLFAVVKSGFSPPANI